MASPAVRKGQTVFSKRRKGRAGYAGIGASGLVADVQSWDRGPYREV